MQEAVDLWDARQQPERFARIKRMALRQTHINHDLGVRYHKVTHLTVLFFHVLDIMHGCIHVLRNTI